MNLSRLLLVFSVVFLEPSRACSQKSQEDFWLAEQFSVSKPSSNMLAVAVLATRQTYTRQFAGEVSNVEICPAAGFLSFRVSEGADSRFGMFDLESRTFLCHQALTLDAAEQRWSPSGDLTYVKLDDATFGILATTNLQSFLQSRDAGLCSIIVAGDPAGCIFQEEWMCDRFLLFGTGQGTEMSWGVLDTRDKCCHYLDSAGYKDGPRLNETSRAPSRLRYLAATKVLYDPCVPATFHDFWGEARKAMERAKKPGREAEKD